MDIVVELLNYLKQKHYVDGDLDRLKKDVAVSDVKLRKGSDLFIRDAITGLGTILEEDLDKHYYITTVKVGIGGNVLSQAFIQRDGDLAKIAVYAQEGLIKQHLANKGMQKLKEKLG